MLLSIKDTCRPLADIMSGAFNAEIFTANLQQVVSDLKTGRRSTPYSNAALFFSDLTFPTEGTKLALGKIARRLSGDAGEGAVTSLITGFGGGKTHTLIGMLHIASADVSARTAARSMLGDIRLPEAAVRTAVMIGDVMDVVKTGPNKEKLPGTLWASLAQQVAEPDVVEAFSVQANDLSSPGESFFEAVLGDRPCLILIDEIAQYATRFEAAFPGQGADVVAAFLMSLFNYAKRTPGIAVVVTLAESKDAFSQSTGDLLDIVKRASGDTDIAATKAQVIHDKAVASVSSVAARDVQSITPVTASEIAGVLARRLFSSIEPGAAQNCAESYRLQRERQKIIAESVKPERFTSTYPFHPTFIDLLTDKLSTVPTFQGTRGVLRTLALAVRAIWTSDVHMPAIHTMHVDLTRTDIVDELIGRTGQTALRACLEKDVGGTQDDQSIASDLDRRNPHPTGAPYHVFTWRTVFLHSLSGRQSGANRFGVNETDAVVSCIMPRTAKSPEISVSQVSAALSDIVDRAYYLRNEDGICFADATASINLILRQIEANLPSEGVRAAVRDISRRIVSNGVFDVVPNVSASDEVLDKDAPTIVIVDPYAEEFLPETVVYEVGRNKPRINQNVVHVLVPTSVRVPKGQVDFIGVKNAADTRREAEDAVRTRAAVVKLKSDMANYGLQKSDSAKLDERDRSSSIVASTKVAELYRTLWHPSADGVVSKQITFTGKEGGQDAEKAIIETLRNNNEVVDGENSDKMAALIRDSIFEGGEDLPSIGTVLGYFAQKRSWPLLMARRHFEAMLRRNVESGHWATFRFRDKDAPVPEEIFHRDAPLPLGFAFPLDYQIIRLREAVQRGWIGSKAPSETVVANAIRKHLNTVLKATVSDIANVVATQVPIVSIETITSALSVMISNKEFRAEGLVVGKVAPETLVYVQSNTGTRSSKISLEDRELARFLNENGGIKKLPLTIGKGLKSTIDRLTFTTKLMDGGVLLVSFDDLTPKSSAGLSELFETMATVAEIDAAGEAEIRISAPVEGCSLAAKIAAFDLKG